MFAFFYGMFNLYVLLLAFCYTPAGMMYGDVSTSESVSVSRGAHVAIGFLCRAPIGYGVSVPGGSRAVMCLRPPPASGFVLASGMESILVNILLAMEGCLFRMACSETEALGDWVRG